MTELMPAPYLKNKDKAPDRADNSRAAPVSAETTIATGAQEFDAATEGRRIVASAKERMADALYKVVGYGAKYGSEAKSYAGEMIDTGKDALEQSRSFIRDIPRSSRKVMERQKATATELFRRGKAGVLSAAAAAEKRIAERRATLGERIEMKRTQLSQELDQTKLNQSARSERRATLRQENKTEAGVLSELTSQREKVGREMTAASSEYQRVDAEAQGALDRRRELDAKVRRAEEELQRAKQTLEQATQALDTAPLSEKSDKLAVKQEAERSALGAEQQLAQLQDELKIATLDAHTIADRAASLYEARTNLTEQLATLEEQVQGAKDRITARRAEAREAVGEAARDVVTGARRKLSELALGAVARVVNGNKKVQ